MCTQAITPAFRNPWNSPVFALQSYSLAKQYFSLPVLWEILNVYHCWRPFVLRRCVQHTKTDLLKICRIAVLERKIPMSECKIPGFRFWVWEWFWMLVVHRVLLHAGNRETPRKLQSRDWIQIIEKCIAWGCDTYSAAAAFHSAFDKGGIVCGAMIWLM